MSRRAFLGGAMGMGLAVVVAPACSSSSSSADRPLGDGSEGEPARHPALELPEGWDHPMAAGSEPPFCHAVASGDPTADRVVIWTRLTVAPGVEEEVPVAWTVARDPELADVVARGEVATGAHRDWTVKVDVDGLEPGGTYHYAFDALDRRSPVGRTRTAPPLADGVGVAVVACSSYWSGHWNAYERIAERDDLHLVVHCGDHVYDTVDPGEWVRARGDRFDEDHVDFRTWRDRDEVRRRYALHYSDPGLVTLHLAHPFTIAWDNHDIDAGETGDELLARQVFWEWTPCRPPDPVVAPDGNLDPGDPSRDHRHLRYGDLDLFVLDLRTRGDDETILGAEQRDWFRDGLRTSAREGAPWRLVVNPIPIAAIQLGGAGYGGWTDREGDQAGMLRFLRDERIDDCLFLSGDAHGAFVADLPLDQGPDGYDPATGTGTGSVAVEILGNSVSRGGLDETLAEQAYEAEHGTPPKADRAGLEPLLRDAAVAAEGIEADLRATNPSLRDVNWRDHGYGLVRLTPGEATLEQWLVPHLVASAEEELGSRHVVARGTNHAAPAT